MSGNGQLSILLFSHHPKTTASFYEKKKHTKLMLIILGQQASEKELLVSFQVLVLTTIGSASILGDSITKQLYVVEPLAGKPSLEIRMILTPGYNSLYLYCRAKHDIDLYLLTFQGNGVRARVEEILGKRPQDRAQGAFISQFFCPLPLPTTGFLIKCAQNV